MKMRLLAMVVMVIGLCCLPTEAAKKGGGPRLCSVERLEGEAPDKYPRRNFDALTPIDPHEHIVLETGPEPLTSPSDPSNEGTP